MQVIKFFIIVSATLIRPMCFSVTKIKLSKPDGFTKLGDAVIQILMTCYPNKDKTIVLAGDFPGDFMEKLSSHRLFSLISLHDIRRAQNNIYFWHQVSPMKHKTHIVVLTASFYLRFKDILLRYFLSAYDNPMASLIVIGWSPYKEYGSCKSTFHSFDILHNAYENNMLNANLICRERSKGIIMYTINPFVNHASEPWQFVTVGVYIDSRKFYIFTREYREEESMCTNLDFDRTQNLADMPIPVVMLYRGPDDPPSEGVKPIENLIRRVRIQDAKRRTFIDYFIAYANASRRYLWSKAALGDDYAIDDMSMIATPLMTRGASQAKPVTYPHGVECKFLVSQFRGSKSQLQKILGVIDNYSYYAMLMVYIITLMFFKYLMGQSVMAGILNLCRLTCNCGLPTRSPDVGPRIYLGCLLFFVITMQGIFSGNLASLLTHDIAARQINSIQDLVDLKYTVYAHEMDFVIFEEPAFKDLTVLRWSSGSCVKKVEKDSSTACLIWGANIVAEALDRGLYISTGCIALEYICTELPKRWPLQEKLNTFLSNAISTVTTMTLDARVEENRFLEAESEKVPLQPRVMTLENLGFAWSILGIGLAYASIAFIIELIIYRYQHRIVTTRVIDIHLVH